MRASLIARLRPVLQPGFLLEALRTDWVYGAEHGLDVLECHLLRLLPRGEEGFVLEYRVELGDGAGRTSQRQLLVEICSGDARQRYEALLVSLSKPRRRQLSWKAPTGAVDYLGSLGLVVRLPGFDERLPGLKLLHRPRLLRPILAADVLRANESAGKVRAQILGHRLGKRCTVRFAFKVSQDGSSGRVRRSVIGKFYKKRSLLAVQTAVTMAWLRENGFHASSPIRVPNHFRVSRDWQTQIMEDVPGSALCELSAGEYRNGAGLAGEALAKLHTCPVRVSGCHSVDDELAVVTRWVKLVGELGSDLAPAADRARRRVVSALELCRTATRRLVHRDFYDRQVLIDGQRVAVIDFDTLCHADPAIDVGNFLAHLELARARGECRASGADEAFLAGYGAERAAGMGARIEAYSKSALLRLACMVSFEAPPGVAETLLERIE